MYLLVVMTTISGLEIAKLTLIITLLCISQVQVSAISITLSASLMLQTANST